MHSVENISANKIKEISKLHQKKYRDESGLFIAEGLKAIEELINENIEIQYIYALKNKNTEKISNKILQKGKDSQQTKSCFSENTAGSVHKFSYSENFSVIFIDETAMKKIATTSSPCEILAVARKKDCSVQEFKKLKKIILLDSISDPGNLGTIIRSAAAFGIEGIILYRNCVDLYSPKVIRSGAGNFFKTSIIHIENTEDIKTLFPEHTKIATSLSDTNNISLNECAKINKYIVMFGSEANGLCKELINISDKNIKLEMKNNVESLNLSVSTAIILYELNIQNK